MAPGSKQEEIPATLIPGNGIGPEIVRSAVDILEALCAPFEWEICQGGLAAVDEFHDPPPPAGGEASTADFTPSIIRRLGRNSN